MDRGRPPGEKGRACSFEELFACELRQIRDSRDERGVSGHLPDTKSKKTPLSDSTAIRLKGEDERNPFLKADDYRLFGLAFSGGGIRSATFNLGILQALARKRLLKYVDYVSTVSGGGYIGSWLHAWVARHPDGIRGVQHALRSSLDGETPGAEPPQVQHLRRYSNYLTPSKSLFGADSWTVVTTYMRNLLLNQIVLFTLLALAMLVPYAFDYLTWYAVRDGSDLARFASSGLPALLMLLVAFVAIGLWDPSTRPDDRAGDPPKKGAPEEQQQAEKASEDEPRSQAQEQDASESAPQPQQNQVTGQGRVQWRIVVPLFLAAYFGTLKLADIGLNGLDESAAWWQHPAPLLALTALIAWATAQILAKHRRRGPAKGSTTLLSGKHMIWAAAAALVGGLMVEPVAELFSAWGTPGEDGKAVQTLRHLGTTELRSHVILTFGPPLCVAILSVVLLVQVALSGPLFSDPSLEWASRLGAWLLIYSVVWIVLFGTSLLGAPLFEKLDQWVEGRAYDMWNKAGRTGAAATGVAAWLLVSIRGVMAARKASAEGAGSGAPSFIMKVAPYVFIIGLLLLVALGVDALMDWLGEDLWSGYPEELLGVSPRHIVYTVVGFLVLVFIAVRLDINKYSMHSFYRDRLVRCYLGASNSGRDRKEDNFTGFTPSDDEPLHGLDTKLGPMPIVNGALNLVGGDNLAWQERKAASFSFTPGWVGFEFPDGSNGGYRQASEFGGSWHGCDGIPLGSCMAISGAAASPNMGFRSSAPLTFLMTIFNVRLGWWVGNPRHRDAWKRRSPRSPSFLYLMRELLGLTDAKQDFCYVSDGGHFENLGVYELVRRRCRYIVVCDAGQDGGYDFDDLGNAIRKCRTDFGVEIDIDTSAIPPDAETAHSAQHCAVGRVHYPAAHPDGKPETGVLVYIKASLTGEEPRDVQNYASRHAEFPHQSTGDQWFDESQFESYRRLGLHVGTTTFEPPLDSLRAFRPELTDSDPIPLNTMFDLLRVTWATRTRAHRDRFSAHGRALDGIFQRLQREPELGFLDAQFYPEWRSLDAVPGTEEDPPDQAPDHTLWLPEDPAQLRAGFYFCNSLFQLMENAYLDLDLEDRWSDPDNRGWVNLFRRWSWSGMFRLAWTISASTYGLQFQRFCEHRLRMTLGKTEVTMVDTPADESGAMSWEQAKALKKELDVTQHLNWVERKRLEVFIDQFFDPPDDPDWPPPTSGFLEDGHSTRPLRVAILRIAPPRREYASKEFRSLAFTYGFAILQGEFILYLRIQDHLRKMGLSRRAMIDLINHAGAREVDFSFAYDPRRTAAHDRAFYRNFYNLKWEVLDVDDQDAGPPASSTS